MNDHRGWNNDLGNNDLGVAATRQEQNNAGVTSFDTEDQAKDKVMLKRRANAETAAGHGHGMSVLPLFFGLAVLFVGMILAAGYVSKYGIMFLVTLLMSGLITVPVMIAIAIKRWPVVKQHLKKIAIIFLAGYVLGMILGPLITLATHIYTIYLLLKCKPMPDK